MTDKEKLEKVRAEIERRKKLHEKSLTNPIHEGFGLQNVTKAKISELTYLHSFIDSMQKEPKECMYSKDNYTDEDRKILCDGCEEECKFNKKEEPVNDNFEVEVKKLWKKINTGHNYSIVDSYNQFYGLCMEIAEWQKEQILDCNTTLQRTFELGKQEMKQQMMANAVDAVVKVDAGGYPYIDRTIELYDYDKDIPLAKKGDKYKVILIKE